MVMVVKFVMDCLKYQVGLDNNMCMDMVVKVALECQKHQVGLDVNKDMDNARKLHTKAKSNWWRKELWRVARINERSE